MKLKSIAVIVLTGLFVYLSLYTWNLRTGHLDRLAENTGLDAARLVLKPGTWVADQAVSFWRRYIHLIGLREENDRLRAEVDRLLMDNNSLREQARAGARMEALLGFTPAPEWVAEGPDMSDDAVNQAFPGRSQSVAQVLHGADSRISALMDK